MKNTSLLVLLTITILAFPVPGFPQEAEEAAAEEEQETPQSAELTAKQQELALLEVEQKISAARKAIAENEKAEEAANAPDTETTGVEGTVTVGEGAGYFAEILAFDSLTDAAAKVVSEVTSIDSSPDTIVISTDVAPAEAAALWRLVKIKLDRVAALFESLETGFDDNGPRAPEAAISTALATLGGIADIAAFFQTNTTITKRETDVPVQALVATVARALLAADKDVVIPSFNTAGNGQLFAQLETLVGARGDLNAKLGRIDGNNKKDFDEFERIQKEIAAIETRLKELRKDPVANAAQIAQLEGELHVKKDEQDPFTNRHDALKEAREKFGAAFKSFDELYAALVNAPDKDKKAPMEMIAAIDVIKSQGSGLLLYLQIADHGGELEVTDGVWMSARVNYLGGTVSLFFLSDENGGISAAGMVPQFKRAIYSGRRGVRNLACLDDLATAALCRDQGADETDDDGDDNQQANQTPNQGSRPTSSSRSNN